MSFIAQLCDYTRDRFPLYTIDLNSGYNPKVSPSFAQRVYLYPVVALLALKEIACLFLKTPTIGFSYWKACRKISSCKTALISQLKEIKNTINLILKEKHFIQKYDPIIKEGEVGSNPVINRLNELCSITHGEKMELIEEKNCRISQPKFRAVLREYTDPESLHRMEKSAQNPNSDSPFGFPMNRCIEDRFFPLYVHNFFYTTSSKSVKSSPETNPAKSLTPPVEHLTPEVLANWEKTKQIFLTLQKDLLQTVIENRTQNPTPIGELARLIWAERHLTNMETIELHGFYIPCLHSKLLFHYSIYKLLSSLSLLIPLVGPSLARGVYALFEKNLKTLKATFESQKSLFTDQEIKNLTQFYKETNK